MYFKVFIRVLYMRFSAVLSYLLCQGYQNLEAGNLGLTIEHIDLCDPTFLEWYN